MSNSSWQKNNHQVLQQGIQRIKESLIYFQEHQTPLKLGPIDWPRDSTLGSLQDHFGLSNAELDIVLLGLAQEIDPAISPLCAQLRVNANLNAPNLMLALMVLPETDFRILSPQAPLLRWQLIILEPRGALTQAPLKLDHRVLCYLLGERAIAPSLIPLLKPGVTPYQSISLADSHTELVNHIAQSWLSRSVNQLDPVLQLCGADVQTIYQIAGAIAHALDLDVQILSADLLPQNMVDLHQLRIVWEREAILGGRILLLDAHDIYGDNPMGQMVIQQWMESVTTPLIVGSRDRLTSQRRNVVTHVIPELSYQERKRLWLEHLGPTATQLNGQLDRIAGQFHLNLNIIQSTSQQVLMDPELTNNSGDTDWEGDIDNAQTSQYLSQKIWSICRVQARPRLDDLAQRIQPKAGWDDLVLPESLQIKLQEIAAHLRQRVRVHEDWGFRSKNSRGLGLCALFAGGSGTGKTMAAEVLAKELNLDLFRVDLSAVTSKYIGETEKNLRRIFDGAEVGSAILLFDEADALFGKRTQVKDSHDRHANIEVSYLLQRMEAYQGLAILTTNLRDSIDTAFLRRIPFVLSFPFPSKDARAEIWQRVFPSQTPTQNLRYDRLSKLDVAGGIIRSIALNAAVLAADANEPVQMQHILDAARGEYSKLERPLTGLDIKDWLKS
ncbi:MAG: ATP-binding protein [Cyanobacteria bacterium P01_F01_bin.150]